MNKKMRNVSKLILALIGSIIFVTSINAQPFVYNYGDLTLGFRKYWSGNPQGTYEAVVDIGPATNYIRLSPGSTVNITQYTNSTQLVPNTFNNLTNLSWSVCGVVLSSSTFPGYPITTLWITVPRVGGVQGPAANRGSFSDNQGSSIPIKSIGGGAKILSPQTTVDANNTATFLRESYASAQQEDYTTFISDPTTGSIGDLQGYAPSDVNGNIINIENTTGSTFTTAVQSDLYELVPSGATDPNNGQTTGAGYYVGYFQLNPDGTMTFTRASSVTPAPVAAFTASPTNGTAPLSVTFSDASTGTITNWFWSFGDGFSVTNTSNVSVNHTYTNAGTYYPSLKVTGPGGNNTLTWTHYILVTSAVVGNPAFNGISFVGGKFVISGSNGTASTQFRVLISTNLSSGIWTPVYTNQFTGTGAFTYTNTPSANPSGFFKLVSP